MTVMYAHLTFMRYEACDTSEIEGEILNRNSVQSSIRRQLGLKAGGTPCSLAWRVRF